MDSISIGIIFTSVTISAIIFLIFKLGFFTQDSEKKPNVACLNKNAKNKSPSIIGKSPPNGAIKSANSSATRTNGVKQVHFSDTVSTKSVDELPIKGIKQSGHSTAASPTLPAGNNVSTKNGVQKNASKNSKKNRNNGFTIQSQSEVTSEDALTSSKNQSGGDSLTLTPTSTHDFEAENVQAPSDELDSSVLLEVFNSNKQGAFSGKLRVANEKKSTRRRQNSDQVNYSSDKLFAMIAASNLSNDEVQLAVETLLNKLDSAEDEWRQPKNDPVQRLKNQLRDTEANLSTEAQNHKQTRARLNELKIELQNEKSTKNSINEELTRTKGELTVINTTLERVQRELGQQKSLQDEIKCERSEVIRKLEQDNMQLQTLLANNSGIQGEELTKLRLEYNEQEKKLKQYELANQNLSKKLQESESNFRQVEMKLDQVLATKRQDDYEACAKLTELESDRKALDNALKEHMQRIKELSETNNLLKKSVNELQIMNGRQDDMLKRMRDERHVTEQSMKRTLCEMELELRELQSKLSSKSLASEERLREEIHHFEKELNDAGHREQKLAAKMRQLRLGLSELFPDLQAHSDANNQRQQLDQSDDWVHQYLVALKQLAQTVDELRGPNSNDKNNNSNNNIFDDSPEKFSTDTPNKRGIIDDKSMLVRTNGSLYSRVGSPSSSSRPSSRATTASEHEKKLMETKLVELSDEVTKLKGTIEELESNRESDDLDKMRLNYEHQIKDLAMQRDKLKAQIKIGLDSFKMEQKRALELEEKLSRYVPIGS